VLGEVSLEKRVL